MKPAVRQLLMGTRRQFDYYVDSVNGSDSNSGRAPNSAFRTLSKLDTLKANSLRVGLARGSRWEEELKWSAYTNVYVGSYGSPSIAMPHVECSGTALNASFTLAAAKVNTYEISWTHTVPSSNAWIQVWENGTALTYVTSAAAVEGTPGSFFASSATTPATVSVHPTGSTNPTTNGRTYEISKREMAIDLGIGGTIRGVWGSRNGHADGSLRASYLIETLATEGMKHCCWVRPGGAGTRAVAYKPLDPTNREAGTMFVSFESLGNAAETVYTDCWAVNPSFYTGYTGFYSHTGGGASKLASVRHRGARGYGLTNFVGASDTTALKVNDAFGERVGDAAAGGDVLTVDNMTVIIDAVSGGAPGSVGRLFTSHLRADVSEVRAYVDMATSGGLWFPVKDGDTVNNCSFYSANNVNSHTFLSSTAAGTPFVRNCVMYNFNRPYNLTNAAGLVNSDYNVVYRQSGALTTTVANVVSASWATHLVNNPGVDVNTANLDPLFTGNPQLGDFTLSGASPAFTGGRSAGSTKTIARPNWAALMARWDAGFLGIDAGA